MKCNHNNYYFSKISDNPPSISNVEEDIEVIPNGVQKNQKKQSFSEHWIFVKKLIRIIH